VTRPWTGLVGQNTSCKAHKVCIALWPMGWDDVGTRADKSPFQIGKSRKVTEAWWKIGFDCVVV